MKDAPPLTQLLIWFALLALVTAAVAALDYFAYGFATHFKGVPNNIFSFVSDPDQILASLSTFPQFIITFVLLWIFVVVLIQLIWPAEITAMLRWAALIYIALTTLILTASIISNLLDNAFDEARLTNLLNGPDLRSGGDALNGGSDIDEKAALAWQLTDHPGTKPTRGELSAVTTFLNTHKDASAVKMEKIYRAFYVSPEVIRILVKHPATPPLVWAALAERAANRLGVFYYPASNDLITAIARDPRTQPEFLLDFLQMPNLNLQNDVMSNPKTTDDVKQTYATVIQPLNNAQPQARLAAAQDPQSPPYVLYGLSWDNDPNIRFAIVSNPNAPLYTIQRLAYDKDPKISQAARSIMQSQPFLPAK